MRARLEELLLRYAALSGVRRLAILAGLALLLALIGRPIARAVAGGDPEVLRRELDSLHVVRERLVRQVAAEPPLSEAEREQLALIERGFVWPRRNTPLSRAAVVADLTARAERAGVRAPVIRDWSPPLDAVPQAVSGRRGAPPDTTRPSQIEWTTGTGFRVLGLECSFTAGPQEVARFLEGLRGGDLPYLIVEVTLTKGAAGGGVDGIVKAVSLAAATQPARGSGAAQ